MVAQNLADPLVVQRYMQMKTQWLLFFCDFTEVECANIYFNAFSAIRSPQSLLESSLEAIEPATQK